jgi:hypothetical protein
MPWQLTRAKRILTSSRVRDYSDSSISKGPKIWTLSQLQEQKRQLDERRSKAEHRRFFITLCERTRLIGPSSHVIEDGGVTDTQDEMDKTTARHATLQTTILCVILIFLLFFSFLNFTVVHLVAAERATCRAHGFYDAKLQRGNGPPLCRPLSTRILNGNPPALPLALRLNLTPSGRYLCWG